MWAAGGNRLTTVSRGAPSCRTSLWEILLHLLQLLPSHGPTSCLRAATPGETSPELHHPSSVPVSRCTVMVLLIWYTLADQCPTCRPHVTPPVHLASFHTLPPAICGLRVSSYRLTPPPPQSGLPSSPPPPWAPTPWPQPWAWLPYPRLPPYWVSVYGPRDLWRDARWALGSSKWGCGVVRCRTGVITARCGLEASLR